MEATAQPTAFAVQNDTRPVLIVIVSIMLILVSLIGISLRIYSRLAILGKLFADDGTNMSLPSLYLPGSLQVPVPFHERCNEVE